MLSNPATKYRAFPAIDLPNRQWPTRSITQPPIWMSTDLRDGNQSLFEPMNAERKMRMFRTLLQVGFKEIEVGFPSASQTDFDFVRELIEGGHVPNDVTIEVLTQSREHLIRRTIESLKGARRAIVHVYNATAPVFRDVVFGMSKPEVKELAVSSVRLIKEITVAARMGGGDLVQTMLAEMPGGQLGVAVEHLRGQFARPLEQVGIGCQISKSQQRIARLARAQKLAGAANLQVAPGNLEAVIGLGHGTQTLTCCFTQPTAFGCAIKQDASRGRCASPHAPSQLVQLAQSLYSLG